MPLLEHFRPPLSVTHPWKGFRSAWANAITNGLNEVLPEGYYAIPEVPLGDQIEIDVATLESGEPKPSSGGVATALWAPPRPRLTAPVDFSRVHGVAVHVFQDEGGPQLRAAIELVSPANKDRPRSRLTFAAKCVGHLERGVAVVVLDTVTGRHHQPACGNRADTGGGGGSDPGLADALVCGGVPRCIAPGANPSGRVARCHGRREGATDGTPLDRGRPVPAPAVGDQLHRCLPRSADCSAVGDGKPRALGGRPTMPFLSGSRPAGQAGQAGRGSRAAGRDRG